MGRERRGGFTLVEALIATSLMTGIFAAVFGIVVSGSRAVESCLTVNDLDARAQETLDRIADDLRSAQIGPIVDTDGLTFREIRGRYGDGFGTYDFQTGEIRWNEVPLASYSFVLDPLELLNGRDDDGDGMADEGSLVRMEGTRSTVVTRHVPAGGFVFRTLGPNRLYLELNLEEVDRDGRHYRSKAATTVSLRN